MMKKILFSTLAVLLLTALFSSCDKYLDKLGENPYALYDAPAEEYIHPIVFKTEYNAINLFRNNICMLMQYGVNHGDENTSRIISNYNIEEGIIDDAWTAYYIQYGNALKMYDKAVKDNKKGLQGIALILRAMLMMQISDTYGNVPYKDAGQLALADGAGNYTTSYDDQKDIYFGIIAMFEDANSLLAEEQAVSFNAVCDKTFNGNYEKWRRFGNSLYARALMRVGMKVKVESAGIIDFDDPDRDPISVTGKLAEIYSSYALGGGNYPVMRGREDRPMIHFDKNNETEQTPFFGYTSGTWNSITACTTLCKRMLDGKVKKFEWVDSLGRVTYPFGDQELWQADNPTAASYTGHAPDPRYICWFRKLNGMPTQMTHKDHVFYYDNFRSAYSKGKNFLGGSMMRGSETEKDPIWGTVHDLQNASEYPLMQFSELLFIFAEAGERNYISAVSGPTDIEKLLRKAITESILEWNTLFTENSDEVVNYVNWVLTEELYSGATFGPATAREAILTQKWISSFFIGIESWCDYRRTGFPLLKTNGSVAVSNDCILPTRMRYPSDEAYRNVESYAAAVNGWLGGSNNMQTDVWWATTDESKTNREKGRQ